MDSATTTSGFISHDEDGLGFQQDPPVNDFDEYSSQMFLVLKELLVADAFRAWNHDSFPYVRFSSGNPPDKIGSSYS